MTDDAQYAEATKHVEETVEALDGWVSEQFTETAKGYARRAELEHPINRAPTSIAAGAVYLAGLVVNEKRTQGTVAEAAGTSEPTVRAAYKEIADAEGIELATTRRSREPPGALARLRRRLTQ